VVAIRWQLVACFAIMLRYVAAGDGSRTATFPKIAHAMFVRRGGWGGIAAFRAAACATGSLGIRVSLTSLGSPTTFLLPLGSLPAAK